MDRYSFPVRLFHSLHLPVRLALSWKFGLGVALVEGHRYSLDRLAPDILAQLDADGQGSAEVLPRLIRAIDDGCDLAIGWRFVAGGKNELPFYRRMFSIASSLVFRLMTGQHAVREVTNLARAFTPDLYSRIDIDHLPWRQTSFVLLPAFLHEVLKAGATYKEVPLMFKDREQGSSKNQILAYARDMLAYCLDARLQKLGLKLPIFAWSRRACVQE